MTKLTITKSDDTQDTAFLIYVNCVEDVMLALRNNGTLTTPNCNLDIENHFGEGYIIISDIVSGDTIAKAEW
jgi:hypothetical protein